MPVERAYVPIMSPPVPMTADDLLRENIADKALDGEDVVPGFHCSLQAILD